MHSLKSEAVKTLFYDASDEQKLEILSSLCESIDYSKFLENKLVLDRLVEKICDMIDKIYLGVKFTWEEKEKDKDYLKYCIKNSNMNFDTLSWLSQIDILTDFCAHVRPSSWKYYSIEENGDMILYRWKDEEMENLIPFNFSVDIVKKGFPINKLKKMGNRYSPWDWYEW